MIIHHDAAPRHVDDGSAAICRLANPSKYCFVCWIEDQSDKATLAPFPGEASSTICAPHAAQMTARSDSLKSSPMLSQSEYACICSLLHGLTDSRSIKPGYRFTPLTPDAMRATLVLVSSGLAALAERNSYGVACFAMTARCADLARSYALTQGVQ